MNSRATELINKLGLQPHPEGGFYREVYRSPHVVKPADDRGSRAALTTIYFLLTEGQASRWHLVDSDEVWHLYEGGPLELFDINPGSKALRTHRLAAVGDGEGAPVCTIPAGRWQAARTVGEYALMGCTVGPGFDFADFTLLSEDVAKASVLRHHWPDLASLL